MQQNSGFTLIELMIVVAIIGILAAIAIPSYQVYTARAQVSEALTILGITRSPLMVYYTEQGVWPTNLSEVNNASSGSFVITTSITEGAGTSGALVVKAAYASTGVHPELAGKSVALATADGGKTWDCGRFGTAAAHTTVLAKHLPKICQ